MTAPAPQSQPGTTALIGPTDCLRDEIAERIWRAEYRRATGKERVIEWAEVGEPEVIKYLYVADAILQLPSIATLQARVEELTKALTASDDVVREVANTYNMETSEGRRISLELAKIISANSRALAMPLEDRS